MGCDSITIRIGQKIVIAKPTTSTPDVTAYTAGDAIFGNPIELKDVFDINNGAADLIEFYVQNAHASALVKKGITAYFYSRLPLSSAAAMNAADDISVADSPYYIGKCSVATGDYKDPTLASIKVTTAMIRPNITLYNDSAETGFKKSLWVKLCADEAITYTSGTTLNITFKFLCH